MIYILDGPDGVGKSTLANAIYEETKGHILHCTWKKEFVMKEYFADVLAVAKRLNKYQDVIIDRWAPSEQVYGDVFRGGPSFDVHGYLWEEGLDAELKFIICENQNAIENHLKNKETRVEMFETMEGVVEGFNKFVEDTDYLDWIHYDFTKVDMKEFVKELVNADTTN